jgi:hypothetical protein
MTHRQLITKVLRERGLSERDISRKIAGASIGIPINPDEQIIWLPGISEEEGIKGITSAMHKLFDHIDSSPAIRRQAEKLISDEARRSAAKQ